MALCFVYAKWHNASYMLSAVELSNIMLNIYMLSVFVLNVFLLNILMPNTDCFVMLNFANLYVILVVTS